MVPGSVACRGGPQKRRTPGQLHRQGREGWRWRPETGGVPFHPPVGMDDFTTLRGSSPFMRGRAFLFLACYSQVACRWAAFK